MTKATKRHTEEIAGNVIVKRVLVGTASEHDGVVLETNGGEELLLQRIGGTPFRDPLTREMVGQRVRVKGVRVGHLFRFTEYSLTD